MTTKIILISKGGLQVAETIKRELQDAGIFTTIDIDGCVRTNSYEELLTDSFGKTEAFVFVGAMGICVRMIAPYVKDKYTDPAVVCVDSTGRFVIPVLSGHIGRANELASHIASMFGVEPVITTQSDRTGLWPLDTIGVKFGWSTHACLPEQPLLSEREAMNRLIALFVGGEPTLLCIEADVNGVSELERTAPEHVTVRRGKVETYDKDKFGLVIRITAAAYEDYGLPTLYFVPKVLKLGIGLARQAQPVDEIRAAIERTLIDNGLNPLAVKSYSTIDAKRDEPVVKALQADGQTVTFFSADELKDIDVPTPSDVVNKHMGTASVSEASAILSADMGRLIMPKQKGEKHTVAVAVERGVMQTEGHIEIVGAGPGDPELVSVRGKHMLQRADLILYAGSLVPRELTFYAKPGAVVRSSASMNLEEQFALMKEFYDRGRFIVRLHTGDPCIYGAIEEQMNYFDKYRMSYHITPGISSFQAAAAELKSQFTIPEKVQTIILTRGEGRTAMPEREKLHLLARSQSTMCIFLSASIADKVQAELLMAYPEDTPVAVCYHLTWKDQRIFHGRLKELAAIVKDNNLTLTTMIVVGEAIGNRSGLSRLYADEFKHLFRK